MLRCPISVVDRATGRRLSQGVYRFDAAVWGRVELEDVVVLLKRHLRIARLGSLMPAVLFLSDGRVELQLGIEGRVASAGPLDVPVTTLQALGVEPPEAWRFLARGQHLAGLAPRGYAPE